MSRLGVTIVAFASFSAAMLGALGGCTPSATAICERICECTGCSELQRADCIDDLEDNEKAADDAGCGLEFNDVARCYDDAFECRNDAPRVTGCDVEIETLQHCASGAGVGAFGNPCELATRRISDRFEECGIQVDNPEDEQPECTNELGRQATCIADCVDATSCGGLTGDDQAALQEFSDCTNVCIN